MKVEIVSPQEILLTPETKLEANVVNDSDWSVEKVPPEPLGVHVTQLKLTVCQLETENPGC